MAWMEWHGMDGMDGKEMERIIAAPAAFEIHLSLLVRGAE